MSERGSKGSVHEKMSERGSKGSMFYPNLGSILNAGEYHNKNAHWDIESQTDDEDHESEAAGAYCDESLRSPLISCQTRSMGKPRSGGSALGVRCNTILMKGNVEASEAISSSMDTGGGWQLAYKYSDRVGEDGKKEGGIVGINGVLYYTPQVYEQASIAVLLFNIGLIPTCISLRKCHYNFLNASLHCYAHVANGYNWQKDSKCLKFESFLRDLSDEESDYEFEYEVLFDDTEEWVSANGLAGLSDMRGQTSSDKVESIGE
ncbi:hypothetical protein C1H46_025378 [Malus baccata]|uniref:Uncharacterized protein n=1 Tax=Malus baccata TaxID=106549 RepID=A0A540LRG9_MALBA|nr:hypothetical protein C1H46_025378 [Malus baccata]